MTQWSREYLYTGKEREKLEVCMNCKNSFKYCDNEISSFYCSKRQDDCGAYEHCGAFKWRLTNV